MVQAFTKITEKESGVMRMKEEHMVRRMLDVDIPGNSRGQPNLTWNDAPKRDRVYDGGGTERGQHNKQGSIEEYDHHGNKAGMKKKQAVHVKGILPMHGW